jgi:hypothetical protein
MQTREETNTDASLRNTPLAVRRAARDGEEPKQTRMLQDLFPREVLREPGFLLATGFTSMTIFEWRLVERDLC